MPTLIGSSLTNLRQSLDFFIRSTGSPERQVLATDDDLRARRYELLYQIATGVAFDDEETWRSYRQQHGLYRGVRQLWDHAGPLCDFYAYRVWTGTIPEDGLNLPNGVPNAIPFAPDTRPEVAGAAAGLLFDWSFQSRMHTLVWSVAAVGEMLAELRDRPGTGRVDLEFLWPGFITDLDLNTAGDVRGYVVEYLAEDRTPQPGGFATATTTYVYRREVTKDDTRTYRDGKPFGFTDDRGRPLPAVVPNPYGFVPACWFRHHPTLGPHGEPAIAGTLATADEINSILSHLLDKTHVALQAPIIVSGPMAVGSIKSAVNTALAAAKRVATGESRTEVRQTQDVIEAPSGSRIDTINVGLLDANTVVNDLKAGVEKRIPELVVWDQLRKMTQVTGPAAARLFGDVEPKFRAVASNHDRQLVKLLQMGMAIAGWRVNRGDWTGTRAPNGLTARQERFRPFGLESFGRDDLTLNIMPRELFPMTEKERVDLMIAKKSAMTFLDPVQIGRELGYDEAVVRRWIADAEARQEQERAAAAERFQQQQQERPASPVGGEDRRRPPMNGRTR